MRRFARGLVRLHALFDRATPSGCRLSCPATPLEKSGGAQQIFPGEKNQSRRKKGKFTTHICY